MSTREVLVSTREPTGRRGRSRDDTPTGEAEEVAEATEELEEAAEERNPDPITRREAEETELMDEDLSELGEAVGDEID